TIYMSDQAEAAGVMFTSVLDAIQGDGFNPLWQEVQIVFKTIRPKQFLSDNNILAAAAAGQIALVPTTEVYRCAVVGSQRGTDAHRFAPERDNGSRSGARRAGPLRARARGLSRTLWFQRPCVRSRRGVGRWCVLAGLLGGRWGRARGRPVSWARSGLL